MAFSVSFHEEAQAELDAAVEWYEKESGGLGWRFHSAVTEAVKRIAENPTFYGICFENYRDVALRKFPYRIVFKIVENSVIVYAVFHGHRDEIKLLPRLK